MPNKEEIEVSVDSEKDITIVFPPTAGFPDRAWITVDLNGGRPKFSLAIIRTDEGFVLDAFADEGEMGEPVATTYAFDTDLVPEDEEAL